MDEWENSSVDLEQLLRSKSWSQLSAGEQTEVLKFISGREEYEQLSAMIHQLKTTAGVHDAEMKPSRDVRDNLLNAFDAEQRKRKAGWWTNISQFLNETIRFDVPAVRMAIAAVFLFAVVFGAMKLNDSGQTQPVAKQETPKPAPSEPGTANPQQPDDVPQQTPAQPENNVVQDNNAVTPLNQPQLVQVPAPLVQDSLTNRMAVVVPDSASPLAINPAVTNTNAFCCGTSNGTLLSPTSNGGIVYTWSNGPTFTNTVTNGTVYAVNNGLPARSRSLAEDAAVMDVFFAVK